MAQIFFSSRKVILGSSTPQISSEWLFGLGGKVGLGSIRQEPIPSGLRATVRWESPRRSSTRSSKRTSPPIRVTPALKTEFAL